MSIYLHKIIMSFLSMKIEEENPNTNPEQNISIKITNFKYILLHFSRKVLPKIQA